MKRIRRHREVFSNAMHDFVRQYVWSNMDIWKARDWRVVAYWEDGRTKLLKFPATPDGETYATQAFNDACAMTGEHDVVLYDVNPRPLDRTVGIFPIKTKLHWQLENAKTAE